MDIPRRRRRRPSPCMAGWQCQKGPKAEKRKKRKKRKKESPRAEGRKDLTLTSNNLLTTQNLNFSNLSVLSPQSSTSNPPLCLPIYQDFFPLYLVRSRKQQ